jgi:hypothetical protein
MENAGVQREQRLVGEMVLVLVLVLLSIRDRAGMGFVFSAYGRGGGIVRVEGAGEVVWLCPLGFVVLGVGFSQWERGGYDADKKCPLGLGWSCFWC